MKTAMQELIERLLAMEMDGRIQIYKSAEAQIMFDNHIKELLEKEKEQIKNVFEHCWNHPNWKGDYDIKDMNDYINQNK